MKKNEKEILDKDVDEEIAEDQTEEKKEIAKEKAKKTTNTITDEFKPRTWLLVILIVIALIITVVLINGIVQNKKEKRNGIFNIFSNVSEEIDNGKENFNKKSFNGILEMYSGTKSGFSIYTLLDNVITKNKTNNGHIITVVYGEITTTDSNEIVEIKEKLNTSGEYEVMLDYDEEGYVNKVTIEDIKVEPSTSTINFGIDTYSGKNPGVALSNMFDNIRKNNKNQPDYQITVVYGNDSTTDSEGIKNIQKSLGDWTDYDVTIDYDEKGYVNKVTIKEW